MKAFAGDSVILLDLFGLSKTITNIIESSVQKGEKGGGRKRTERGRGETSGPTGEKGRSEREGPPLASPGEPVVLTGSHQGVGPSDQQSANPLNHTITPGRHPNSQQ